MVWVVGLGPVGLDSDWIPENERDCWPWGYPDSNPKKQTKPPISHLLTMGCGNKNGSYISDDVGEKQRKEKQKQTAKKKTIYIESN